MHKEAELRHRFNALMRERSADQETWRGMYTRAGATSGVLEDMNVAQLTHLILEAKKLPVVKTQAVRRVAGATIAYSGEGQH